MSDIIQKSAVNLYSANDLKNTTDDHIPRALSTLGYQQLFFYDNVTLALGYSSVVAAAAVAYVEYTIGFKTGFNLMAAGFVAYLIISAVYYYWAGTIQKGASYIGEKGSQRVYIKTKGQKSPDYTLIAKITDKFGRELSEKEIVSQYNEWFDTRGFLVQSKLNDFVKQALPESEKKTQ